MTTLVKEQVTQNQLLRSSNQRANVDEEATRRFIEETKRSTQEHEERIRELKRVKENLPEGKEKLDIDRLDNRLRGLYEYIKTPRMIETFELEYYLDRPEIKNTDEFVDFIIKTRGQA